jgi:23S rRNA (cytosine1962-C5)-methyltransferase
MSNSVENIEPAAPSHQIAGGFGTAQVWLKSRKAQPFFGRHPWVLDSAVHKIEGTPADGDVVDLISDKGRFIARGLFNSRSRLRVRLYTWDAAEAIDEALFRRRLETAIALRRNLGYTASDGATRLVYSEADGLSGLIVDRYGEYLSLQATSLAIWRRLDQIVPLLMELTQSRGVVLRQERGAVQMEGMPHEEGRHWGDLPAGPVFIEEHGLRYGVDLREGHKTGFYLDQRDNRRAVANFVQGRRMLDAFCYSGGFALNAVKHGQATDVLCVDSSEKALALARANAELNGISNLHFRAGDGFDVLQQLADEKQRFGIVVLDPPKFARSRSSVSDALMAYHRINRLAVSLLEPGGILVSCSCSGHVLREDFLHMLAGVAQRSNRDIQVLQQRGAAPDHPISTTCLESEYLKCFVCRVS